MYIKEKQSKNILKVHWQSPLYPFYRKLWIIYNFFKRELSLFLNEYQAFKIEKMRFNEITKKESAIFAANIEKKILSPKEEQLLTTNLRDNEYADIIKKIDALISKMMSFPDFYIKFNFEIKNFFDRKEKNLNTNLLQDIIPDTQMPDPLKKNKKKRKRKKTAFYKNVLMLFMQVKQKTSIIQVKPLAIGGITGIFFVCISFIFITKYLLSNNIYAANEFEEINSFEELEENVSEYKKNIKNNSIDTTETSKIIIITTNTPTPSPTQTPIPTSTPQPSPTPMTDVAPPVINIISGPENLSVQTFNNFCFEIKISDNSSAFEKIQTHWIFDNANWSDWSENTVFCFNNIANGNHTFTIQVKNESGNLSNTETRTFTVQIP